MQFYDEEAEKYLNNFDENLFRYDENEEMPLTHQYFYSLLENIKDKMILDCCCGHGFASVKCAKRGARVTGIDISPKMIQLAKKNAQFNNVANYTNFEVMSAQKMNFKDEQFDYVIGIGALHHLNLEFAAKEISRVLRPEGRGIFIEPRIPFKWLIFIRSLFPNKCFESPGGSQLNEKDLELFLNHFSQFHFEYFMFLKKLSRFPLFNKVDKQLDKIDSWLIKKLPHLKLFYWAFVLEVIK